MPSETFSKEGELTRIIHGGRVGTCWGIFWCGGGGLGWEEANCPPFPQSETRLGGALGGDGKRSTGVRPLAGDHRQHGVADVPVEFQEGP